MGKLGGMGGVVAAGCLLLSGCHHDGGNGPDGGSFFHSDMSALVGNDLATGGGGSGGSGGGGPRLKASIDLTHVHGFAVAAAKTASPHASRTGHPSPRVAPGSPDMATAAQQLYAIDDSGALAAIALTTSGSDMGTPSDPVVPSGIYNVARYVVFAFFSALSVNVDIPDMGLQHKMCAAVILRKADGALFCYETTLGMSLNHVESDGADSLFFGERLLVRVDMGGDVPMATTIEDGQTVSVLSFAANSDGDALAVWSMNGTPGGTRVYKRGGGLQNLAAITGRMPWVAPNGHDFYYVLPQTGVSLAARQSDGSYTITNGTSTPNNFPTGYAFTDSGGVAYGYFINNAGVASGVVELVGPSPDSAHTVTGISATSAVPSAATQQVFFLGTDNVGNGGIVRLDYPSFAQTTVLAPGAYSVSLISLAPNGDLTFTAVRNSDGAHVLATVPAGTTTVNVSSATAPMVTTLTRIN